MYNYNLLVNTGQMVIYQYITTDVNLLEMYKAALVSGHEMISWEKGVIDLTSVVGIIDTSPSEPKK